MTKEITEEKAAEKKGKSDTNVTPKNKEKEKQSDKNSNEFEITTVAA